MRKRDPLRIVLLEDNPHDRLLIQRSLDKEFPGAEVTMVMDEPGWREVLANPSRFDLVITDYQLRWTTGLDIIRQSKSHDPRRPVIMFTATGSQEIAVEAMKSGLDDYVIKAPQHYVRLPVAVRQVLERTDHRQTLEQTVAELQKSRQELLQHLSEIEQFQTSTVGRELRMIELEREVKMLRDEVKYLKSERP
jgi:DNA-binding NtrC family response regulator